jgi:hypothetical protein
MKAQGYAVKDNVLFQDKKSSIILEKNGKASSTKRTNHINIRYFFITDRVSKEEFSVVWCPTGVHDWRLRDQYRRLRDQSTPGGALFRKFRDQIMGVTPARDRGPGKTDSGVGKTGTNKNEHKKGKVIRLVPPGKQAALMMFI